MDLANLIGITIICHTKISLLLYSNRPSLDALNGLCPIKVVSAVPTKTTAGFSSVYEPKQYQKAYSQILTSLIWGFFFGGGWFQA
jgi:hypothetical protein